MRGRPEANARARRARKAPSILLDVGLDRLRAAAAARAREPLDDMCAHLVADPVGQANEDDVTVLAVRVPLRSATGSLTWAAVREPEIPLQALVR